jgi:hypothetical protein
MSAQTFDPIAVRKKAIAARKEMMSRRMPRREPVSVSPSNDDVRRGLRHPHAGGFPESGMAHWPLDRFTRRRLIDKSVTLAGAEGAPKPQAHAPAQPRTQPHNPGPQPHRAPAHRDDDDAE